MRIPNTAELLAFFATTGQLTGFSNQPGADLDSQALAPECGRPLYPRHYEDTCNSIAERYHVPTYQIICQNDKINGKCDSSFEIEQICLGRKGEDCSLTHTVEDEEEDSFGIAYKFKIPEDVFKANNYCDGDKCPPFRRGSTVCVSYYPIGKLPKCEKTRGSAAGCARRPNPCLLAS